MKRLAAITLSLLVLGCASAKSADATKASATAVASDITAEADGSLARIRKSGALRVGADLQSGLPFWAPGHNASDPPDGYEAAVAALLAKKLGVTVKVVPTRWADLLSGLNAGLYDVVINGIETPSAATRKKWDSLSFSRPYMAGGEWIIVPPEDKTSDRLADLKGMQVAVLSTTVDGTLLEAANKQYKLDIKIISKSTPQELYKQLESRAIEAAVMPQPVAAQFLVQHPTFRVAGKPIMPNGYVIATRQEDKALLNAIDAWLAKADTDKTYQALAKKWKLVPGG